MESKSKTLCFELLLNSLSLLFTSRSREQNSVSIHYMTSMRRYPQILINSVFHQSCHLVDNNYLVLINLLITN